MSERPGDLLKEQGFEDGEMLYSVGDPADAAYVIKSGSIELLRRDEDGFYDTVRIIGPGQIFGEEALVAATPHIYSARAKGETACLVILRKELNEKLAEADNFIRGMFRVLIGNFSSIKEIDGDKPDESETEKTLRDLEVEGDDGDGDDSGGDEGGEPSPETTPPSA